MTSVPLPLLLLGADSAATAARAQPAWLWGLEGTLAVLIALLLCALLGALAFLGWRLSKAFERLGAAVEKFREDLRPVTDRTAAIAEHLERAAAAIRENVDDVGETVRGASAELREAVETAGERFREFDAIVRIARDEAEDVVLSAASVMHGVRGGVSAFRQRRPDRRRPDARPTERPTERPTDESIAPRERRRGGPRLRRERSRGTE